MIESRQDTDFRTVFRIFIGCFNSLFFVPNFQPKFWQGDQIYLIYFIEFQKHTNSHKNPKNKTK